MYFNENKNLKNLGRNIGFLLGLFLFFSVFYFILNYFNKLPEYILYRHIIILIVFLYIIKLGYYKVKK